MDDLVQLAIDNDVAIITISNPPVNALSPDVARGIAKSVEQAGKDISVKAVVLMGAGRTFVAGADIKEFGKITSGKSERGAGLLSLLSKIFPNPWWSQFIATPLGAGWSWPWPATIA